MIHRLRRLHDASPAWLRAIVGPAVRVLPPATRYGRTFTDEVRVVRATEWDPGQQAEVVERRTEALLEAAGRTERMAALGLGSSAAICSLPWVDLPLLRRTDLVEGLDRLRDPALPPRHVRTETTSGSTGDPVAFLVDRGAGQRDWAYFTETWRRLGVRLDAPIAMVARRYVDTHVGHDAVRNELIIRGVSLHQPHLDRFVDAAERHQPRVIHGLASGLDLLAREVGERLAGRLRHLACVSSASEVLLPHQRARLEETFGVPVVDTYGQSERAGFSSQCERTAGHHVASTYGVVELVDDQDRPITEPGVSGRIVLSSFVNRAMPLLRYEVGDLGRWGSCDCGRPGPVLERVDGRLGEVNVFRADGSEIPSLHFNLPEYERIARYRMVQTVPGEVHFLVELRPGGTEADAAGIASFFARFAGEGIVVTNEVVDHIPPLPNGKHRVLDQRITR